MTAAADFVSAGDRLAQPRAAPRIGVAELQRFPPPEILGIGHFQQFRERKRLGIG